MMLSKTVSKKVKLQKLLTAEAAEKFSYSDSTAYSTLVRIVTFYFHNILGVNPQKIHKAQAGVVYRKFYYHKIRVYVKGLMIIDIHRRQQTMNYIPPKGVSLNYIPYLC
jgi:hypothetical protein